MKTLETVLADLTNDSDQNTKTEPTSCEGCGAKEGKPHPTRGFDVVLQPVDKEDIHSKEFCAICRLNQIKKQAMKPNSKTKLSMILKQYGLMAMFLVLVILVFSGLAMAQPGLPTAPSQAPIDGGLGLLAAAGGAYAIKKLREKRNGEEELG